MKGIEKVTNTDVKLKSWICLSQCVYPPNILFVAFSFNYAASIFTLIRIFSLVLAATTYAAKIILKMYKFNLFLFVINH